MGKRLPDKVLTLPRDFTPAELPSVLKVPWDLLLAANPEGVKSGRGREVSLGGRYQVEAGDTIWTISDELSQLGPKISPFDIIKYNVNIDPHWLQTGSVLVVPTARAGVKQE